MNHIFRKAIINDIPELWSILQEAIIRRKCDGSSQWQDGYPNIEVIQNDIRKDGGYVLTDGETIIGYAALFINDEPAYENIEGRWLTAENFVVVHRIAISGNHLGQGLARTILEYIEEFALENNIISIKADTNFDNFAMMKTFDRQGYIYCGEVYLRGGARRAYEKVLR